MAMYLAAKVSSFEEFKKNSISLFLRRFFKRKIFTREVYLRKYIQGIHHGVFSHIEGRIVTCNNRAGEILGYDPKEVIGRSVIEFVDTSSIKTVENNILNKTNQVYEVNAIKKDGTIISLEVTAGNIDQSERVATFIDITERKKIIDSLTFNEFILNNTAAFVWTLDLKMNFTYASGSAEQVIGFDQESILKKKVKDILTPESFSSVQKLFAEELSNDDKKDPNRYKQMVIKQITKDNKIIDVEITMKFIRDSQGKPIGILGMTMDITDRKKKEDQIREIMSRQTAFFENISDGAFEVDPYGNFRLGISFNRALLRMIGYSSSEVMLPRIRKDTLFSNFPELNDCWQEYFIEAKINNNILIMKYSPVTMIELAGNVIVNPQRLEQYHKFIFNFFQMNYSEFMDAENRKKVFSAFNELWNNGGKKDFFNWEIIKKNGEKVIIETTIVLNMNKQGEKIGFLGTIRNITEKKAAEIRERQYNERTQRLLNSISDVIIDFDKNVKLIDIVTPPSAYKMTGYSKEELLTMKYQDFLDISAVKELKKARKKLMLDPNQEITFNLKLLPKYGDIKWVQCKIGPNDNKDIEKGFCMSVRDITELYNSAIYDYLTQIYNRASFEKYLKQYYNNAKRYGRTMSLALIDVNNFKEINDTEGHPKGDEYLKNVAQVLTSGVRENDIVARVGGDEFAIIFSEVNSEKGLDANRVIEFLKNKTINNSSCSAKLSIGIFNVFPNKNFKIIPDDLYKFTDQELYLAKEVAKENSVVGVKPSVVVMDGKVVYLGKDD